MIDTKICHRCKEDINNRRKFKELIESGNDLDSYEHTRTNCTRCEEEILIPRRTQASNEREINYGGEKLKAGESPKTDAGWIAMGEKLANEWGPWSDMRGRAAGIIGELIRIIKENE